jgi:hypothetical protein
LAICNWQCYQCQHHVLLSTLVLFATNSQPGGQATSGGFSPAKRRLQKMLHHPVVAGCLRRFFPTKRRLQSRCACPRQTKLLFLAETRFPTANTRFSQQKSPGRGQAASACFFPVKKTPPENAKSPGWGQAAFGGFSPAKNSFLHS